MEVLAGIQQYSNKIWELYAELLPNCTTSFIIYIFPNYLCNFYAKQIMDANTFVWQAPFNVALAVKLRLGLVPWDEMQHGRLNQKPHKGRPSWEAIGKAVNASARNVMRAVNQ